MYKNQHYRFIRGIYQCYTVLTYDTSSNENFISIFHTHETSLESGNRDRSFTIKAFLPDSRSLRYVLHARLTVFSARLCVRLCLCINVIRMQSTHECIVHSMCIRYLEFAVLLWNLPARRSRGRERWPRSLRKRDGPIKNQFCWRSMPERFAIKLFTNFSCFTRSSKTFRGTDRSIHND